MTQLAQKVALETGLRAVQEPVHRAAVTQWARAAALETSLMAVQVNLAGPRAQPSASFVYLK